MILPCFMAQSSSIFIKQHYFLCIGNQRCKMDGENGIEQAGIPVADDHLPLYPNPACLASIAALCKRFSSLSNIRLHNQQNTFSI